MAIAAAVSSFVLSFISHYGYFGIFLLMALEAANIPIPSEIILPFSGFLVFQGHLSFPFVVAVGAFGNLFGSFVSFIIGASLGRAFILNYGKYILIPEREFLAAENWFKKYGKAAIFLSRILPVVRTFISLPAGVAKMDLVEFGSYTFLGCAIWTALLTYIGVALGSDWQKIIAFFNKLDIIIVLAIAVFFAWYLRKFFDHAAAKPSVAKKQKII